MTRSHAALVAGLIFAVAASASAQRRQTTPAHAPSTAPMKAIGSVKEIMEAITIPTSEAVFTAASEPPKTDAEWTSVRRQALALAESSNLLLMDGRAPDRDAWTRFSLAQRDAAVVAMKSAQAKDADALSAASDALYETCDTCHKQYMPGK
jgi:hypothetical protein